MQHNNCAPQFAVKSAKTDTSERQGFPGREGLNVCYRTSLTSNAQTSCDAYCHSQLPVWNHSLNYGRVTCCFATARDCLSTLI